MATDSLDSLRFDADGLVPVTIQDAASEAVLMLAFMNAEALALTRATGRTHFWSRSRGKIWKKGESSGHEQFVEEMFVNCELNSLLITVVQVGAVCHTGHPTCYYRRVESDGSLVSVRDRWFDPADVYGNGEGIEALTRTWQGAYSFLRDNDLAAASSTSRSLRSPESVKHRIADELTELAGIVDGTHSHGNWHSDLVLEGSQVLYWLMVEGLRSGIDWNEIRPDRALDAELSPIPSPAMPALLRAESRSWAELASPSELGARIHATMRLVATAVAENGVSPRELIEHDLVELREKPYLATYFSDLESSKL